MSSTVDEQLPPPPQPPQPHRISTSCDRHPDEQFTGFCPSCLFERLSILDQTASSSASNNPTITAGRKSASSAFKSIFRSSAVGERPERRSRPRSFLPELRRTKSFSSGKNDGGFGFAGIYEQQRKSCDVRDRNTLWSLFNQDQSRRTAAANSTDCAPSSSSKVGPGTRADQVEVKFGSSSGTVTELKEERNCEQHVVFEQVEGQEEEKEDKGHRDQADSGEIEEIEESFASNNSISNPRLSSEEQGGILEAEKVNLKPMKKGNIDLDCQTKKAGGKDLRELAGSFWSAASVFSKKLKAWTRKNNKLKKHSSGGTLQVSKKSGAGRSCRETQSEIADYGCGRRSCDIDPRFSIDAGRMSLDYGRIPLDAGRMSFDDPRYSFDEPRASWDGYLIGGGRLTNFPRLIPPMVSVREDPAPPLQPSMTVLRKDNTIHLEEPRKSIYEEEGVPGGAAETKDYYLDSSSRRRKSLDRSSSMRRTAVDMAAEVDEMKSTTAPCNSKVTPGAVDYLHGGGGNGKVIMGGNRVLRDSNPNSRRDDSSESFDLGFRDSASVVGSSSNRKVVKKSRSWRSWNIWGLIGRRGGNKDDYDDDDRYNRENGAERSYYESWQELGRDGYGVDPRGAFNRNLLRSNSSVSWRNSTSNSMGGSIGGSLRKSAFETNGHGKSKDIVLERNRSGRYSPNHVENGQLRFSVTPMKGSHKGPTAEANGVAYSNNVAGSALPMY